MKIAMYLSLLFIFSTKTLSIENPTEDIITDEIIPIGEVKYPRWLAGTRLNLKSNVYREIIIRI